MNTAAGEALILERSFEQADFDCFASLSGDDNPIHVDPGFAAETRFGRTVSHGMLLATVARGLVDGLVPGATTRRQKLVFPAPTFAGEALRFSANVAAEVGGRVLVRFRCVRIADGTVTLEGEAELERRPVERA